MLDDSAGGWSSGGAWSVPPVDDAREWFWTTLDRWPDPAVTNGPRLVSPSSQSAFQLLQGSHASGSGPLLRCVVGVTVASSHGGREAAHEVLGASILVPSGDDTLDRLAQRLYPAWQGSPAPDGRPREVFRVSVYARALPAEVTFDL